MFRQINRLARWRAPGRRSGAHRMAPRGLLRVPYQRGRLQKSQRRSASLLRRGCHIGRAASRAAPCSPLRWRGSGGCSSRIFPAVSTHAHAQTRCSARAGNRFGGRRSRGRARLPHPPPHINPHLKLIRVRHLPKPPQTPQLNWPLVEPAVQIAIPAEALFPLGAVPQGVDFVADLSIAPDGSAKRLRLEPQLIRFERSR